jgi:cytochrome P450 family 135
MAGLTKERRAAPRATLPSQPATDELPPGPRRPAFVQTLEWILDPKGFMTRCRRRYGDTFSVQLGPSTDVVFVSDPGSAAEVFQAPPEQMNMGDINGLFRRVLGRNSLLVLDGAEHMRQRKLLLPAFHGERMRAYEAVMLEAADRVIDSWPIGEELTLQRSMQSLTLEVIARAVFGVDETNRRDELIRRIRAMIDPVGTRLGLLIMVFSRSRNRESKRVEEFERRRRHVDELIYAEIADRREQPDLEEREDVLSMLLLARDEDGQPMTDPELRDELVTLLVAGHETTATALAWAFELLMRNPRVLAKAREGDDKYIDAVVKETLRIRPVISGVGRVVRGDEPFELDGHLIPPGTEINPNIAAIHRRADRYPAADDFRPERFLGEEPPDTYSWIPFGGGTRRCLGASFATFEMRTVIKRVLERADLSPVGDRPEPGVRKGITFVPKRGARAVLEARR